MTVKVQLKEIRTARNISQNELARLLEMSLANVQKIEYGKAKSIPLDTLDKLCKVLKCEPGDLLRFVPDDDDGQEVIIEQEIKELKRGKKSIDDAPPHGLGRTRSSLALFPEVPESA